MPAKERTLIDFDIDACLHHCDQQDDAMAMAMAMAMAAASCFASLGTRLKPDVDVVGGGVSNIARH